MSLKSLASRMLALMAFVAIMGLAAPQSMAQQVNPTEQSVQEEELMRALQSGQALSGRITIPDGRAGNLITPGNPNWAGLNVGLVRTLTVVAIVGMLALLAAFYLFRGKIRVESGLSGRRILRFGALERTAHWMLAVSFIVLALTGLNLVIGRQVILPLVGESAFGTLSSWGKLAHNYLAWPFMIALVVVLVVWVAHNIPSKIDWEWIKKGGGFLSKGVHPPSKKFNAGQKLIFWAVVLGGAALSFTGVMLLFPQLAGTSADWQLYQLIHGIVAAFLSAAILAHIYIGTIGMEGAFDAMGTGEVDLNWAREHHSLWVDEAEGRTPAPAGTAAPIGTKGPVPAE